MLETLLFFSFTRSSNFGAIDRKMDGSVLEEKSYLKMLRLSFSSKLDRGSYIVSIKTASKKIGVLFRSMKFPSPEPALYHTTLHGTLSLCLGCCS